MKNVILLLLSCTFLLFSCKSDDESTTEFRYDDDNFSAPELPAGTFDAAIRIPSSITDNYIGWNLHEVEFYIQDKPADCEVLIFAEGDNDSPGNLIYSKNVIGEVSANSWTAHVLDTPVEVKDEDIWIGVRVVHNSAIRSIGCDEGPARTNGDWMLGDGETDWVTYRALSTNPNNGENVDINWNIRGQVRE